MILDALAFENLAFFYWYVCCYICKILFHLFLNLAHGTLR